MADIEHDAIPDGERHEPKGADAALVGQGYVSDGAQSGNWAYPAALIHTTIDDISTLQSVWAVSPIAGNIIDWWTVIDGVIAAGDAILTLEIATVLVTGSSLTIANAGSAAGDVDNATPSALNTVTAGQAIEVLTDGGSTNVVKAEVYILVRA